MEVNVNDYVKVKLTEKGHEILKSQHDELREYASYLGDYIEPKTDDAGFTKFQLWTLMETFGPYIGMCKSPPFGVIIRIPTGG
jgi:hypothetical protein